MPEFRLIPEGAQSVTHVAGQFCYPCTRFKPTEALVAEERRATLELIEHLREIERRMLYLKYECTSLWDFAVNHLKLSHGSAQRRIEAMRLMKDVPEARESLLSGELSLTNAARVQTFRRAEKKMGRNRDGGELVAQVLGLSQTECEKKLIEISPEALPQERERIVSAQEEREFKIVVSKELYEKLQRLKGLLAHSMPDATYAELIEHMADEALDRLEKKKGIRPSTTAAVVKEVSASKPGERIYLSVALTRPVWQRAQGRCEVIHQGKRCESRYRLEIDHVISLKHGGSNAPGNLRLACWHHNQWLAMRAG